MEKYMKSHICAHQVKKVLGYLITLLGFVAQKPAGVMSSFLREEEALTKMARLSWKMFPVSSPSSKKYAPPMIL